MKICSAELYVSLLMEIMASPLFCVKPLSKPMQKRRKLEKEYSVDISLPGDTIWRQLVITDVCFCAKPHSESIDSDLFYIGSPETIFDQSWIKRQYRKCIWKYRLSHVGIFFQTTECYRLRHSHSRKHLSVIVCWLGAIWLRGEMT